ncbi:MAG: TolC family protein [Pseudobdellovibrio sp.]
MKIFLNAFCILFLQFNCFVYAVETSNLTWQKSLELLKENNPDYKIATLNYQAIKSLENSAQSGYYPSISGGLAYNQTSTSVDSTKTNDSFYSASLTLSQSVFAGLKDYYKSSQAQANTRLAKATLQAANAKLGYDFTLAFQNLLSAQENFKLAENILHRRQENLRLVELKFESGRENKGSRLLAEAYLAQGKYESLQARHSVELAQVTFAQMVGLQQSEAIVLIDQVPAKPPIENPRFSELAIETPDYQQVVSTYDANLASVGVAKSAFFPTLGLTGVIGRNSAEFFPKNDRWSIGASITIPLFDGGRDYATVKNTSITRDSSEIQKTSVDQKEIVNLKLIYQKFIESIEKMKVDESFQKALVLRSEIARTQYNNGLVSFIDWDNIENDLILRQKTYLQSKKDRALSEATWNQARGTGVF